MITQIGGSVARKLKGEMQTAFTDENIDYTVGLQVVDPFQGYVYENEEYFPEPQAVPFETQFFPDELAVGKWKKQKKWATKRDVKDVTDSVNNLHTKREAIEWRSGLKVTDPLQLYSHEGVEYLPNSKFVPFTTEVTFDTDKWVVSELLTTSNGILYVDSADLIKTLNLKTGQVIVTKGRLSVGDGFGAIYIISNSTAADGFFNLATKNGLTAVCQNPFSLMLCGAVGDYNVEEKTGADDSDAIEFFFNTLEEYTGDKTGFAADWEAQSLYAKTIKIEAGNYLLTRKIKRGLSGSIYHQSLQCESGAFIHAIIADATSTDYAIELHQLQNCNINLHVRSENCGALLIDTALKCDLNLNVGCLKGEAALKYQGVIFNCLLKHKLNQNVAMSSIGVDPNSWMLLADFSKKTHLDWTGMVICQFERIFAAGGGRGIKLLGGSMSQSPTSPSSISDIEIGLLEAEGITNIALEVENFNNVTFRNQWSEATGGHAEAFVLSFKNGLGLKLDNIKVGELRDNVKIHGVSGIILDNMELGTLSLGGSIYGLQLNNPRFKRTKARDILTAIDGEGYNLAGLQLNNPMSITEHGIFSKMFNSVRSGGLPSSMVNYVKDTTLKTENNPYYGSWSDGSGISPLNVKERVFTVAGQGRYPSLKLNLKDVNNDFVGHIVYAIKSTIPIVDSGIVNANSAGVSTADQLYGTYHLRYGDWHVFVSEINVIEGTSNTIDVVWNYPTIPKDGDTFTFGGAFVFSGLDIRVP